MRLLIEQEAALDRTEAEATPLIAAAGQGHLDVVRLLVEAGADKNFAMNAGVAGHSTALEVATRRGHKNVASYLAELS